MKPYAERELFILNYLRERGRSSMGGVDVLNAEFVNAYVAFSGAGVALMPYGAHKCPTLGRDLSRMHRERRLRRFSIGLPGFGRHEGFPKWVWNYTL